MRIYTSAGELAFSEFTFSDGQPHFKLETYDREFETAAVEMALTNPSDLFRLGLVVDVLRQHGYSSVNIDVRYLMGARMDRAISTAEPYTLRVVARAINALGANQVRIFDAHSDVATRLIRNATNILPHNEVAQVAASLAHNFVVVAPDKGAVDRVTKLTGRVDVQGTKTRDIQTGQLTNFSFSNVSGINLRGGNILIVDDICDGGGTFIGLANAIKREYPACTFYLFVTHGIFSRGMAELNKVFHTIFTTDTIYYKMKPTNGEIGGKPPIIFTSYMRGRTS